MGLDGMVYGGEIALFHKYAKAAANSLVAEVEKSLHDDMLDAMVYNYAISPVVVLRAYCHRLGLPLWYVKFVNKYFKWML